MNMIALTLSYPISKKHKIKNEIIICISAYQVKTWRIDIMALTPPYLNNKNVKYQLRLANKYGSFDTTIPQGRKSVYYADLKKKNK